MRRSSSSAAVRALLSVLVHQAGVLGQAPDLLLQPLELLAQGRGARIAAQAGVMWDVPSGDEVAGSPAQPKRAFFRQVATLKRMARIQK